jgi:Outer membrane protein Omp28
MKTTIQFYRSIAFLYLAFLFSACDKVEGPYSESIQTPVIGDDTVRKVLLEDYTGHKCQGCPAAAVEANTIQQVLGEQVVIMAVHAGFWTSVNATGSFTYDFKTPTGTELYNAMIPATQPFPIGTVNRKMYGVARVVDYPNWGGKVDSILQQAPDAYIKITPSYDAASRVISATVKTDFLNNLSGDVSLAIYYTEDSIINWQAFPAPPVGIGNISNYVHRHVLRGAITPTWGDVIATNPVKGQSVTTNKTGTAIAADISPGHVHVVAVLANTVSKEVIQVEEVKLIP